MTYNEKTPPRRRPLFNPHAEDAAMGLDDLPSTPNPTPAFEEDCVVLLAGEVDRADPLESAPARVSEVDRLVLSDDQARVFDSLVRWARAPHAAPSRHLSLGGFAGTGKTTVLARFLREFRNSRVLIGAFVGRATQVLRAKIRELGAESFSHEISTLHKLLYRYWKDEDTGRMRMMRKPPEEFEGVDFIVVDEASMVGESLMADLLDTGAPILFVGDHGQLPPVMDRETAFMRAPDLRLERIHRQAEGNTILALSREIRETGHLPERPVSDAAVRYISVHDRPALLDTLGRITRLKTDLSAFGVLMGTHRTRQVYTPRLRALWHEDPRFVEEMTGWVTTTPVPNDLVVCQRNAFNRLFNGMRGIVTSLRPCALGKTELPWNYPNDYAPNHPHAILGTVEFPLERVGFHGPIYRHGFGRAHEKRDPAFYRAISLRPSEAPRMGLNLDFGYTLTVHKAQGSQFEETVLFYEPQAVRGDPASFSRWLYTGVTRASSRMTIVLPEHGQW